MAHFGAGGSKPSEDINTELNLVPLIDLMSVCIIFLLISAVWTQISMIKIGTSIYGKQSSAEKVEVSPQSQVAFRLDVKTNGYIVNLGGQSTAIPLSEKGYDKKTLVEELKEIKTQYPDKEDAVITVQDDLPYEALIGGMDALLVSGFPQIGVATGGPE